MGLPQEPAVSTVRNLVGSVSGETLISVGLLPRLVHVLKTGSTRAQTAAIGTICRICESVEMKKLVEESGCIPLLIKLLEVKAKEVREVAAQALASLLTLGCNA
ncbi:putative armadillo-like helical protein [Helianthus anomalus]